MKILQETWNGKTYYVQAQMTVDPTEVSQRVADVLNEKQKEKEQEKARVREMEERENALKREKEEREIAQKREREEQEKKKQHTIPEAPVQPTPAVEKVKILYQPNAFGLDFGWWMWFDDFYTYGGNSCFNLGIRYTKNISPNVGFDIVKLSHSSSHYSNDVGRSSNYSLDMLTGIRFASNRFGKNKNAYLYTSLRAGVGWAYYLDYLYNNYYDYDTNIVFDTEFVFVMELDAGIHFKYFFLGATVNHNFFNRTYVYLPDVGEMNKKPAWGLRFGWDMGMWMAY